MRIIAGKDIQSSQWQGFVRRQECFTHDLRWREVYQRAYGLHPYYLAAQDGPELVGTMPLVRLPGICTQGQLVSLPFLNYAGVAAVSPEIATALEQAALGAAARAKAGSLVLRSRASQPDEPEATEHGYCQLIRALPRDEQTLWEGLRSEKRTRIRKSWRCGVEIKRDRALLPVFFKMYQAAMRGLGSPPHSARWFQAIMRAFAQDAKILVAYHQGIPIASLLLIMWGDACHGMWAAGPEAYRKYSPSDGLYWEAMRLALAQGKAKFNFGRSMRGGGSYYFKRRYGAVPYQLCYERLGSDGSQELLPQQGTGTAFQLWRKLPLALSNALGPKVRCYVLPGFGARSL
ncbi:MAG: GNAT family N-acetyltransferase [Proteobacteria bacterium]|nr:GNAT family N-acetyltransferase [Pseudomonadota bacterium]MBU4277208.1 GNAT family N-acetyltransferase [Pseudomonadota bacterium]MBU4385306.1 GNAT family N-acetyltransferase [Pseudomonadota bacterium]MBU4606079.1 GNAT family N-acetyltransferase [Pseudomonadota bacterium]MCG2764564.1 GNAT family N-acetyltransferase [Desulfarculaceae bacterium]